MVHTYCLLFDPCVLNAYTMRRVDVRAFPPCGANSIQVAQVVHGYARANDINLILGPCPFRSIPSSVDELERLKRRAGLERAVASGFRSLLYYDTLSGLHEDMVHYGPLRTWLSFYATINPRFPQMEKGVRRAAADERIAAVRACCHRCTTMRSMPLK